MGRLEQLEALLEDLEEYVQFLQSPDGVRSDLEERYDNRTAADLREILDRHLNPEFEDDLE